MIVVVSDSDTQFFTHMWLEMTIFFFLFFVRNFDLVDKILNEQFDLGNKGKGAKKK